MNKVNRSIVIVEPEVPENTGFISRLCANFGFKLKLVNPKFNLSKARSTANNNQDILREAKIYNSLEKALEEIDFAVGTKPRKGTSCENFNFRNNTSIVLGRESSGLTNQELKLCDATVYISTKGYNSLNLSHAASILMYEATNNDEINVNSERLRVVAQKSGEKVRELIARGSPTDSELDQVLGEL